MTKLRTLPFWILAAAALGLSGCNQQQGTEVTVKLINQWGTPATATVVYQVGNGDWKLAAQKDYGVYTFVVPPGETRYGVSANCLPVGLSTIGFFSTYQLTTNDTTEVVFPCLNLSDQSFSEISLDWDASALGANRFEAYDRIDQNDSGSTPLTLDAIIGEDEPFLFLAYSGGVVDYANLEGVRFERFDTTPNQTHSVTFTASDTATFGSLTGPSTPTGFNDCDFDSGLVIHNGLYVPELAQAGGNPCNGDFLRVPGTSPGDVRMFMANYRDPVNNRTLVSILFTGTDAASASLPALPSPWPTSYAVDAAALPSFDLNHPDGDATGYLIFYNGDRGPFWQIYVSPDWLAGATSYSLPDLSQAPDFGGIVPLKGDSVDWEVIAFFSDRPIGDWLSTPTWMPAGPVSMPVLPGGGMTAASIAGTLTVP